MGYANPQFLVETDWLGTHLDDQDLRILDCSAVVRPAELGRSIFDQAVEAREIYERTHIRGAAHADLLVELSDTTSGLRFTMPTAEQFAAAAGKLGVGPGTKVVCYDQGTGNFGTRMWWMLKTFGFDNASVLNGGWKKWIAEGRPVSSGVESYPENTFEAVLNPRRIATKQEVLESIGAGSVCIVNALSPAMHKGEVNTLGRPGHIPSSVNVHSATLLDPGTHTFLPQETLRSLLSVVGDPSQKRVITYCGGGISATGDAFALELVGYPDVAVYDGSMSEWARDPSLPLEVG